MVMNKVYMLLDFLFVRFLEAKVLLRDLLSFCFTSQSLLVPSKSFLLNRAVRPRPVKEMRWLTGITGYTLMRILRQSWLVVKVLPFSSLIKKFNHLALPKNSMKICKTLK